MDRRPKLRDSGRHRVRTSVRAKPEDVAYLRMRQIERGERALDRRVAGSGSRVANGPPRGGEVDPPEGGDLSWRGRLVGTEAAAVSWPICAPSLWPG